MKLIEAAAHEEALDTIIKNYSDVFNQFRGVRAFAERVQHREAPVRGVQSDANILVKDVRADRHPKDSSAVMHHIIDDAFVKVFGHRYRSNSAFITTDVDEAAHYGNVYVVIPASSFKVCYSPEIPDLYTATARLAALIHKEVYGRETLRQRMAGVMDKFGGGEKHTINSMIKDLAGMDIEQRKNAVEYVARFIQNMDYHQTKNLREACDNSQGNEMMLACQKYYLIKHSLFDRYIR